ncbi:MAG: methyl-accepting chemotaxis protein [Oceanospirillaceae bacterium]
MLNNLTVKAKLSLGNALVLIFLLGFSGYFYLNLTSTTENTSTLKNYIHDQANNGTTLKMVNVITFRDQLQKDYQLSGDQKIKQQLAALGDDFSILSDAAKAEANEQQRLLIDEINSASNQLSDVISNKLLPLVDRKSAAASSVNNELGPKLEKMSSDLTEYAIKDNDSGLVSISSRLTQKLLASRAYFNLYMNTGSGTLLERSELEVAGIYYQLAEMKKIASRQKNVPYKPLFALAVKLEQQYQATVAINAEIKAANAQIAAQTKQISEQLLNQILGQWQALDETAGTTLQETTQLRTNGLIVILAIIIANIFIIWFIGDSITKGLQQLLSRLADISDGDGDLTKRVELKSRDEIGQLAASFNRFIEQIQNLVASSQRSSIEVDGYASSNVEMAAESKLSLEQQLEETNSISVSIEELSASADNISQDTQTSNNVVSAANDSIFSGQESSQSSVSSVTSLHSDITDTHSVISDLAKEADSISSVVEVIKSMSEQTNLLALNAAIEAARAGEAGRGFAVVADEVRSLANRTKVSVMEIEAIIDKLQNKTGSAVKLIDKSLDSANINKQHVIDTQDTFKNIEQSIVELKDIISSVANACNEQSQVTSQVSEKVATVYSLSQHSAKISEKSAEVSMLSASSIVELNSTLNKFKV